MSIRATWPRGSIQTVAINGSAGADVSVILPDRCGAFLIQSRSATGFRVGYVTGAITAGNYLTIADVSSYGEEGPNLGGTSVFLRGDTAGSDTLELLTWANPPIN